MHFKEAFLHWVNEQYEHKRMLFEQQQQWYEDANLLQLNRQLQQ